MPISLTPSATPSFSSTIAVMANGDDVDESSHVPPFQTLLDNTAYLNTQRASLSSAINQLFDKAGSPFMIRADWNGVASTYLITIAGSPACSVGVSRLSAGIVQIHLSGKNATGAHASARATGCWAEVGTPSGEFISVSIFEGQSNVDRSFTVTVWYT